MSDLNYYAAPPAGGLPHRTGLTVWGVVLIVLGSIFALSGVGTLAGVAVAMAVRGAVDGRTVALLAMNCVMSGTMGGGLIWLGVGCCRGRRWVRPLAVAGGSVAAVSGVVSIVPVTVAMAAAAHDPALAGGPGLVVAAAGAVFTLLLMVGVPVAVVAWFRRPSVADTLGVTDPASRWTDAVPVPVLAWTLACLWLGWGAAFSAAAGVTFWFTATVTGWRVLAMVVIGVAIMGGGVGSFRGSATAWGVAVGLLAVMAASAVTFVVAGDTTAYRRHMAERTAAITRSFVPATSPPPGTTARPIAAPRSPAALARSVDPELAPALLYVTAVAFGFWVRPRLGRAPTVGQPTA